MPEPCYRCGTPLEEPVPFCPSCKAPQIKVTRQQEAVAPSSGNDLAPPFITGTPPPPRPGGVQTAPWASPVSQVQWKKFLRISLPFAAVNGLAVIFSGFLGVVIFVPGSVVWSIFIYRRRFPGPLSPGFGARMGASIGLLSFVPFALIVGLAAALNSGEFRRRLLESAQQFMSRHPNPDNQQALQFLAENTVGTVIFALCALAVVLVLFATAAGALTVAFSKDKSNS